MATDPLDQVFNDAAAEWNVHPDLLRAVAGQESGGTRDPDRAVSSAGAQGRMQLMPDTARELGVTNTRDARQNIFGAAKYLSQQLDTFGSPELAIAAYNAGPGRVNQHLAGAPLPAETQAYIPGVTKRYQALAAARKTSPAAPAAQPDDPFTAALAPAPATSAAPANASPAATEPDPFTAALGDGTGTPAAAPPAPEPSLGAKIGAGLIRGVHDVVDRPAEWLARGADALGITSGQGDQVAAGNAAGLSDYNAQMGDSSIAGASRFGGQMALTVPALMGGGAVLGGAGRIAAAGAGAVSPAAGAAVTTGNALLGGTLAGNRLLQGASLAANGALSGAAAGALTSGQSDESVGQQALQGAGVGALAGPVIGALGLGVRNGWQALTGSGGGVVPETAQLARLSRDTYGIPVYGPQLSDSSLVKIANEQSTKLPFSGAGAAQNAQASAFQRAVSNTFGENVDRITPDVMSNAAQRIGQVFDNVASRTSIQADPQFFGALQRVGADAQQVLTGQELHPITTQIQNLVQAVQRGNGTISGDAYQALTRANTPLARASQSANPNVRYYAGQVREALDDAFSRSVAPQDQAALGQARGQYRAMKTVEDLVEKSTDGNISPALLMGQVRSASSRFDPSTGGMAYTGGGPLGDLARIGQEFLKAQPNSGTADRMLMNSLALGGQGSALGAVMAGAASPFALAAVPAGLAGNRALGSYLRSNWYANRLINSSLAPQGASVLAPALPYAAPVGAIEFNGLNPDTRNRLMNPIGQ